MVCLKLTRKLADKLDGINLCPYRVGQKLQLPWREAMILMAEGWAELVERRHHPRPYAKLRSSTKHS
jgi:hypothetical protein